MIASDNSIKKTLLTAKTPYDNILTPDEYEELKEYLLSDDKSKDLPSIAVQKTNTNKSNSGSSQINIFKEQKRQSRKTADRVPNLQSTTKPCFIK